MRMKKETPSSSTHLWNGLTRPQPPIIEKIFCKGQKIEKEKKECALIYMALIEVSKELTQRSKRKAPNFPLPLSAHGELAHNAERVSEIGCEIQ